MRVGRGTGAALALPGCEKKRENAVFFGAAAGDAEAQSLPPNAGALDGLLSCSGLQLLLLLADAEFELQCVRVEAAVA